MEKLKKKWEIPKLICLYRGRPEEAVLAACKGDASWIGGPGGSCHPTGGGKGCSTTVET